MEQKEIEIGNGLIALFMGAEYFEAWSNPAYHHPQPHFYFKDAEYLKDKIGMELKYHSSWDWLHPVMDKIKSIDASEFNYNVDAMTNFRYQKESITSMRIIVDIEHAWSFVVEFIKWYNTNSNRKS